MNGFLYKDFLNLKPSLKIFVLLIGVFAVAFLPTGNEIPVYVMLLIIGAMLPITSLSLDAMSKWDRYARTLPVLPDEIVRAKYLLMIAATAAGSVIALGTSTAVRVLLPREEILFGPLSPVLLILIFAACALLLGSLGLPLAYRFGVERMRYLIMLIALAPMLIIFGIGFTVDITGVPGGGFLTGIFAAGLLAAAAVTYVSYRISVRIYANTEW